MAIFHIQFLFSKITADVSQRFVPRESKYSRFILPLGLIKPEDHLSRTDEPQRHYQEEHYHRHVHHGHGVHGIDGTDSACEDIVEEGHHQRLAGVGDGLSGTSSLSGKAALPFCCSASTGPTHPSSLLEVRLCGDPVLRENTTLPLSATRCRRRNSLVPAGNGLVGLSDSERGRFVITAAHDLQRRGQPACVKSIWQGESAKVKQIGGTRKPYRRLILVD